MKRITDWVHDGLRRHLLPGDWALDATLGNGHDAQCLVQCVGPEGRVFGLDIQSRALEAAREKLPAKPWFEGFHGDHAQLADWLPSCARGRLRAVVFNLGYLPGGDPTQTTQCASTLAALEVALKWLAEGGVLACTCYPGHPAGEPEAQATLDWLTTRSESCGHLTRIEPLGTRSRAPFLLWFEKGPDA